MKIENGVVHIEGIRGLSPSLSTNSSFTDGTGTTIYISNRIIISMYELLQVEADKNSISFDAFANSLYERKDR